MFHDVRRRVARLLYPYGTVRTVLSGPIRGTKYVVQPGLGVSFSRGKGMNYDFLTRRVLSGMCVYDVGANRGQMALFFSKLVGTEGKVVSFEPVPDMCDSLAENLRLNQVENVQIVRAAVANLTGVSAFVFNHDRCTKGRLKAVLNNPSMFEGQEFHVDVVTLDSLIADGFPVPDMIKIDVEGGADGVLSGAQRLLDHGKPSIYIELHSELELKAVSQYLVGRGYVAEALSGRKIDNPIEDPQKALWLYPSQA